MANDRRPQPADVRSRLPDDPTAILGDEDCAPAEPVWSDFSIDPSELIDREDAP